MKIRGISGIVAAAALGMTLSPVLAGGSLIASFTTPTLDAWNYPFASNFGNETEARIFATQEDATYANVFDNRDSQMLIGFDTGSQVTTGLSPGRYRVQSVKITCRVTADQSFIYDPTYDSVSTYFVFGSTPAEADADAGRPIEMFAVGYRNGFTRETFQENSGYTTELNALQQGVRNAYPIEFSPAGESVDVSNNVAQNRDVVPAAVGTFDTIEAGASVPADSIMTFDLNLDAPGVRQYVRESLAAGRVNVMVTSLRFVSFMSPSVPKFATKEYVADIGGQSSRLLIQYTISAGEADFNGTNGITVQDIFDFLTAWLAGSPEADFNHVNGVTVQDIFDFLTAWLAGA